MIRKSPATTPQTCKNTGSAADFLPIRKTLASLRKAAATCRGCDLYCNATQVVFGAGSVNAKIVFVGEQPGDQEDQAGTPFVGPAGKILDKAIKEVGIDRKQIYVTNAVKHFKFERRGKRRIHSKPNARELNACRPWLESEIKVIKPQLIVCLGASAAQSLLGRQFRITEDRGKIFTDTPWGEAIMATMHPSAILRAPDAKSREESYQRFREDLDIARKAVKG